jgi:outer membrane protein assembly factor BamB
MKQINALYILSNGKVAAINKKDGEIIWEVKLNSYGMNNTAYSIGQIIMEDNKLYIGCAGVLLCLEAKDGSLVWKNELKGWGYNFVSIANANIETSTSAINTSAASTAAVLAAT